MKPKYAIRETGINGGYLMEFNISMKDSAREENMKFYPVDDLPPDDPRFNYSAADIIVFDFFVDAFKFSDLINQLTSRFCDPDSDLDDPSDRESIFHFEVVEVLFL